ncbi:YceI family protein [Flavobacterium sp. SM2513]|uniref:YceI family protein n=1 Tax=Flavobacterium sp. SM2513 TaxID=3424766 RepID=UPI003D7F5567
MKTTITLFLMLFLTTLFAQDKLLTKNGKISFEASVPSFEEVKATNENATCILNTKTGEIASLALIKGFKFKVALMQEHFNENYMESNRYPKATFKGTIKDFKMEDLTATAKEYTLNGKLEIHGETKEITTIAKIKKTANGVEIETNFSVNASDFDIEIPNVVKNKISNKINIANFFALK